MPGMPWPEGAAAEVGGRGPVSVTSTVTVPAEQRIRTVARVPAGVCLRALVKASCTRR